VALFLQYWLPVIAYGALVLVVGGIPTLQPPLGFRNADKLYHVLEYAVFGFLLARGLRASMRVRIPLFAAMMAIGLGALLGLVDENHQQYVPGRQSSLYDVMADTVGVILAQVVYMFATRHD
jgi:VanZ family protein